MRDAEKSEDLWQKNVEDKIDQKIGFNEEIFTRILNLRDNRINLDKLKNI